MTYRRLITVIFMLAVASLACSLGSSPTSAPPTNAPAASKTPVNFHNGGVTPEASTEEPTLEEQPTEEQATEEPTARPTKAPTKAATKAPTRAPRPTATEGGNTTGSCTTFKASGDVYWVTLDSNNNIQDTVDSYPADTTEIAPVFNYDCNPKSFQIVTIFSLNGQQVFTDKDTIDATDQQGLYGYPLVTKDNTPFDSGEWGVEFYNAKQLVASGKVQVGSGGNNGNGGNQTSSTVTVQGTITNKAGGKPINGALFVVLNEGVDVATFIKDNFPDSDVYTGAKSDSTGQFTLPDPLKRNTDYSFVVVATGFQPIEVDGFNIDNSQPDPLVLDVQLSK
jgi:hypothetical protein